ncbi:MAG: hypothetical protein R2712_03560 [Vicinamibacterales bacterium]
MALMVVVSIVCIGVAAWTSARWLNRIQASELRSSRLLDVLSQSNRRWPAASSAPRSSTTSAASWWTSPASTRHPSSCLRTAAGCGRLPARDPLVTARTARPRK